MNTGIIFDLDGTLLNTLEDLRDATNHVLRDFGYPDRTMEQIRRVVGNGAENQIRKSLPEGTDEPVVQAALAVYKNYYNAHCQLKTAPYDGIPAALKRLQQAQIPLAIVSNKPNSAVRKLCKQYFGDIFALGESEYCPRKPAPNMVYRAMAEIGVDRCIYVGDSEVDILTAKNAGQSCLSVLWGFRDRDVLEQAGADNFCESPRLLAACLEAML